MANIDNWPDDRWPIGAIRRSEIQAWGTKPSESPAPSSVELDYWWLATMSKAAIVDRLLAASPCTRIALHKKLDTQ